MSFNSKNLQYEKQEPAFLRRLRGAHESADGRNNVQIARPKKARLKTGDDEEDDPVILDENGEVMNKAEFEGMQKNDTAGNDTVPTVKAQQEISSPSPGEGISRDVQQIAEIGGPKKRKQARAIAGDESDGDERNVSSTMNDGKKDSRPSTSRKGDNGDDDTGTKSSKVKKKPKKIKLSFDDPE